MAESSQEGLWSRANAWARAIGYTTVLASAALVLAAILLIRGVSLTQPVAVLIVGVLGLMGAFWTRKELDFRQTQRTHLASVIAAAYRYSDCFTIEGKDREPDVTKSALRDLQQECMQLHLMLRHRKTQAALDSVIRAMDELGRDKDSWDHRDVQAHNALQKFIASAREELGMLPGKVELRDLPPVARPLS